MTNITQIIAIIDKSGSMHSLTADTIGGFNQFLDRQIALEGEASITTVLFSDTREVLTRDASLVTARLTKDNYHAGGSTALYDAIGQTLIQTMQEQLLKTKRPDQTIVVILTDGAENASTEYSAALVATLIDQTKAHLGWSFLYLGANVDVTEEAFKMGLDVDSAISYQASSQGLSDAYDTIHQTIANKRGV
jgi:Mg-chelatase subunit ChlD